MIQIVQGFTKNDFTKSITIQTLQVFNQIFIHDSDINWISIQYDSAIVEYKY